MSGLPGNETRPAGRRVVIRIINQVRAFAVTQPGYLLATASAFTHIEEDSMMEPGVPVFDRRDAEIYGWRLEPGKEGDLCLRVTDGRGAICFPPGTRITHRGGGDMSMRQTVQVIDLEGSVDPDGNVWLADGVIATEEKVEPTATSTPSSSRPAGSCGGRVVSSCTRASNSRAS